MGVDVYEYVGGRVRRWRGKEEWQGSKNQEKKSNIDRKTLAKGQKKIVSTYWVALRERGWLLTSF